MQFDRKLTRRRFGQLTIATSTVLGVGYFATRATAQTNTLTTVLIGVLPAYPNAPNQPEIVTDNGNDSGQLIDVTDSGDGTEAFTATATANYTVGSTAIAKPARELVVNSLDLNADLSTVGNSELRSTGISLEENASLQPYKQVSGLASLSGGILAIATNPIDVQKKNNPTRITVTQGSSVKTLEVLGLKKQDMLESLTGTNNDQLFGLVVKSNGKGDARLVEIDINTGQIDYTEKVKLPGNERFSTLSQCSDGTMYTTSVAQSGLTTLVQLDLNQKKPIALAKLSLDGNPWISGLRSLACSDAGQIFALGGGRYEILNSLLLVDAKTGNISRLREFQAVSIAFVRS
jgi:hypothetical protein